MCAMGQMTTFRPAFGGAVPGMCTVTEAGMWFSRVVGGSCCTAGLRAGVPPATRAALLVHLVHGCVLSGTLAPPV